MKKTTFLFMLAAWVGLMWLPAQTPQIFFEIRNGQVVANGTQYQFDIYMGADAPGTYHSAGILYIGYNPLAFGSNVVSNLRMTATHLDLLNEVLYFSPSTPKYSTNTLGDHETNIFKIGWSTNFPSLTPGTTFHTLVPDSMAPLYRIVLTFQNNQAPKDIRFIDTLMLGQQKYLFAAGVQVPYGDGYFPVEWVHFSADPEGEEAIRLHWITAKEVNNDYFLIEKKADEGTFEVIGRTEGKGTTDSYSEYQFLDQSPMGRVNVYRLRQVDVDGTTSFSSQVEVRFDGRTATRLVLFPSPAQDFAWIRVNGDADEEYRLLLTDIQGKVFRKEQFAGTEQHRIDLQGLPEGVYLLRVEGNKGVSFVRKLVKLNP